MILKPMLDNVVIKIENTVNTESTTSFGLIIPKSVNKERPDIGEVVSVGQGRLLNNGEKLSPIVQKGDKVIFNRYAGTEIQGNEDALFLILKESDILAIIEE